MFDSQTMQMQGAVSTTLLSPWFPRGGDYGLFTLEVTSVGAGGGTVTLTAKLRHKNASDTGDGSDVGGSITSLNRSTAGRTTVDFSNGSGSGRIRILCG